MTINIDNIGNGMSCGLERGYGQRSASGGILAITECRSLRGVSPRDKSDNNMIYIPALGFIFGAE